MDSTYAPQSPDLSGFLAHDKESNHQNHQNHQNHHQSTSSGSSSYTPRSPVIPGFGKIAAAAALGDSSPSPSPSSSQLPSQLPSQPQPQPQSQSQPSNQFQRFFPRTAKYAGGNINQPIPVLPPIAGSHIYCPSPSPSPSPSPTHESESSLLFYSNYNNYNNHNNNNNIPDPGPAQFSKAQFPSLALAIDSSENDPLKDIQLKKFPTFQFNNSNKHNIDQYTPHTDTMSTRQPRQPRPQRVQSYPTSFPAPSPNAPSNPPTMSTFPIAPLRSASPLPVAAPTLRNPNPDNIEIRTKFPVARIKRIMQADEEVGKVAQVTPVAVNKALELFMISLVQGAARVAREKGGKRITAGCLKRVVEADEQFDFLSEIVAKVQDSTLASRDEEAGSGSSGNGNGGPTPKKRKTKKESGSESEVEVEVEEGMGMGGETKRKGRGKGKGGRKKKGEAAA